MQFCASCHGVDGAGNPALGAPNLADDVWLYGDDETAIRQSIAQGRTGQMPAYGDRLDSTQIKLLVALLLKNAAVETRAE
jgi:cytochrome c oxidase cbb3-type subunit 3